MENQTYNKKRRSSFFGYDDGNNEVLHKQDESCDCYSTEMLNQYIQKLERERVEWPEVYISEKRHLLAFWKDDNTSELNKSILSEAQRDYVDAAIDMTAFNRGYNELCEKIHEYALKKDWFNQKYAYCLEVLSEKLIDKTFARTMELKMRDRY